MPGASAVPSSTGSVPCCCTAPSAGRASPSGQTLHAVAFALLLSAFYPSLAPLLWAFALAVGVPRAVHGLH
jgi:undecaprenyl-diphosphatase